MPPPDHDADDDAALIERSWRDPEAFAGLYDRHAAPLHRYAARRLGAGAADDIVADTFLDAFRKRHRYDRTVTDARPWLYGIAANLIGKHSRSEVRMLRAYARTGADPVLVETQTDEADGRLASAAVRQDLAAALAALTNRRPRRAADDRLGRPVLHRGRDRARHPGRHRPLPPAPGARPHPRRARRR